MSRTLTRNRLPTGFRGRLSAVLTGRQDDAGLEPTFGSGVDPQASLFHQADGPVSNLES